MTIEIDEKLLERGSHIEIRKRKDEIVIIHVPRGNQIQSVTANEQ